MLSLVTVSPVITAFHRHHVFDQVKLWPAWVGIETTIFWQCSPGTVETQRLYPLRHGPRALIRIWTWVTGSISKDDNCYAKHAYFLLLIIDRKCTITMCVCVCVCERESVCVWVSTCLCVCACQRVCVSTCGGERVHICGLVYLFNGISTPYGLCDAEIWFICKCSIIILTMHRLGLVYLFNGISTPYGLFNAEIWLICKCSIIIITIYIFDHLLNCTFLFYNNDNPFFYFF